MVAGSRHDRHLVLPELGEAGVKAIQNSRVLVVGLGGLGCAAASYLAAAGVGRLGLIDADRVDQSNLHRQPLYAAGDVGKMKADVARERLSAQNPAIRLDAHPTRLISHNTMAIIEDYDVIVDCSDNFPTRYLINDACVLSKRPYVYGAAQGFDGQLAVFATARGPCYRCLLPLPPAPGSVQNCAEAGVLGPVPAVIGTMQAVEAIKIVTKAGRPMAGRLMLYDGLSGETTTVTIARNVDCEACGAQPTITKLIDYEAFCSGSPMKDVPFAATVGEVKVKQSQREDFILLDIREPYEVEEAMIEGSVHIPMAEIPQRLGDLDPSKEIIVYCRSGARSARVTSWLRAQGYARARNLEGGILAWSSPLQ